MNQAKIINVGQFKHKLAYQFVTISRLKNKRSYQSVSLPFDKYQTFQDLKSLPLVTTWKAECFLRTIILQTNFIPACHAFWILAPSLRLNWKHNLRALQHAKVKIHHNRFVFWAGSVLRPMHSILGLAGRPYLDLSLRPIVMHQSHPLDTASLIWPDIGRDARSATDLIAPYWLMKLTAPSTRRSNSLIITCMS